MGGASGFRGYLVQTGICLLEALSEHRSLPWTHVALEPSDEHDQVDILWVFSDRSEERVQVKSSVRPFTRGQAQRWAAQLETSAPSHGSLRLILVGHGAPSLEGVDQLGRVVVDVRSVTLELLFDEAANLLHDTVPLTRNAVTANKAPLIARALFTDLSLWSTAGRIIPRDVFERVLISYIGAAVEGEGLKPKLSCNRWLVEHLPNIICDEVKTLLCDQAFFGQEFARAQEAVLSKYQFFAPSTSVASPPFAFHLLGHTSPTEMATLTAGPRMRALAAQEPVSVATPGAIFTTRSILHRCKSQGVALDIRDHYIDSMQMVNEVLEHGERPADMMVVATPCAARLLLERSDYVLLAPWHRIDHRVVVPSKVAMQSKDALAGEFYFMPARGDVPSSPTLVARNLALDRAEAAVMRELDLYSGEAALRSGDRDVRLIRWCGAWRLDQQRGFGQAMLPSADHAAYWTDMVLFAHADLMNAQGGRRVRAILGAMYAAWLDLLNDEGLRTHVAETLANDSTYNRLVAKMMGLDLPGTDGVYRS